MDILINLAGIMGHDSQEGYARTMLTELLPLLSGKKVCIVAPDFFSTDGLDLRGVTVRRYHKLDNKVKVILFVQCYLPLFALFHRAKKIYSPTVAFPMLLARRSMPTIHDLAYVLYKDDAGFLAGKYIALLYKRALKRSPTVFTVSEATKKDLLAFVPNGRKNVVVAYPSLWPEKANEEKGTCPQVSSPYFLYIGIYRARKNIEYILRGFKESGISGTMVFAGSVCTREAKLRAHARELGIEDRIMFTGYISDACKKELYLGAKAVVFPSLYEGFGLPVLEAQAWGVPVILSDMPVFREVAGTAAVFVDPHDPSSLGAALSSVLSAPKESESMLEAGRENARRFNSADSAAAVARVLAHE